jgi:hypothetical protein
MKIDRLEQRLQHLEEKEALGDKYIERCVLSVLSDDELDDLGKMLVKRDAGYTESDIEREFGDRYREIMKKMQAEYDRLMTQ